MPDSHAQILLSTADETADLARQLADRLGAGDVLLLSGDIGAGKTHFARSLIQHLLPVPEDVPSPTFNLIQIYDGPGFEIWHADLYRLSSPDEVVELGLSEAFDTALCLVEWPDRLAELAPENALALDFSMTENEGERQLVPRWSSQRWEAVLEGLLNG